LAKANTPETLNCLVRALQDKYFEVRVAAARALGRLGAVSAAGDLAVCLKDPDAAVRFAVAGALRAIGWKPATSEESAWLEITLGNVPGAASISNAPPVAQFPKSNQETSFFRHLAVAELKERNDPHRINSLLVALRSAEVLVRISAVHDLGQTNDPRITEELLTLFRDPAPEVRLAAAQVLAARGDSPPAHFLGLLLDANPEVRLAAVQFFGRIRAHQVTEVLASLLSDPNLQVRQATAIAIGR
jgi:HEAT repeat protein